MALSHVCFCFNHLKKSSLRLLVSKLALGGCSERLNCQSEASQHANLGLEAERVARNRAKLSREE